MSTMSLSASYTSQSVSSATLSVKSGVPEIPKSDPVADRMKQAEESLKVLKKLDTVMDLLRNDKAHTALVVYNRLGQVEADEAKKKDETSGFLAEAANVTRTSITIDGNGIEIEKADLDYASLKTDDGSFQALSMNASRLYLSFGGATGATTDQAA